MTNNSESIHVLQSSLELPSAIREYEEHDAQRWIKWQNYFTKRLLGQTVIFKNA